MTPSEVVVSLGSAALGGGIALAGAWLTWRFQVRRSLHAERVRVVGTFYARFDRALIALQELQSPRHSDEERKKLSSRVGRACNRMRESMQENRFWFDQEALTALDNLWDRMSTAFWALHDAAEGGRDRADLLMQAREIAAKELPGIRVEIEAHCRRITGLNK